MILTASVWEGILEAVQGRTREEQALRSESWANAASHI